MQLSTTTTMGYYYSCGDYYRCRVNTYKDIDFRRIDGVDLTFDVLGLLGNIVTIALALSIIGEPAVPGAILVTEGIQGIGYLHDTGDLVSGDPGGARDDLVLGPIELNEELSGGFRFAPGIGAGVNIYNIVRNIRGAIVTRRDVIPIFEGPVQPLPSPFFPSPFTIP